MHEKKKHTADESSNLQSTLSPDSKASFTKRQKAALDKLEQISNNALNQPEESQKAILEAVAAATTKVLTETKPLETPKSKIATIDSDKLTPVDSAEIDLENEPIQMKRERQRSLVLNLGKKYH